MTRRTTKRRPRSPQLDASVYDGQIPLGRLIFLGAGWRAEGPDGKSLGVYESRHEARAAISEARHGCDMRS